MAIFSGTLFLGPCVGPLIGGWIGQRAGWRWIYWVLFILVGLCFVLTLFIPETLAPVILRRKAVKLRKETGDNSYNTLADLEHLPLAQTLKITISRPIIMMFKEPIVLFMSFCVSLSTFLNKVLADLKHRLVLRLQPALPPLLRIPARVCRDSRVWHGNDWCYLREHHDRHRRRTLHHALPRTSLPQSDGRWQLPRSPTLSHDGRLVVRPFIYFSCHYIDSDPPLPASFLSRCSSLLSQAHTHMCTG